MSRIFFIFFASGCSVVPELFVEKTIFSPLCFLCSFVKDQLVIFIGVCFWVLYSVSLIRYLFFCQHHAVLIVITFQP